MIPFGRYLRAACLLALMAAAAVRPPWRADVQSQEPSQPDVTRLGPQVGQQVPDFTLADQHGRRRSLASLMGPKGMLLVFNRSADW